MTTIDKANISVSAAVGAIATVCAVAFFCGMLTQQVNANEKVHEKDMANVDKRLDKITDALENLVKLHTK